MPFPRTTVAELVVLQQKSTLMERAAIVRYLRRRLGVTGSWLAEVVDAVEAGAHLYDNELFTERHDDGDSNDRTTTPDGSNRA